MGEHLQTVANPQYGNLQLENARVRHGSFLVKDTARPTREDDATGPAFRNLGGRRVVGEYRRINLTLTNTPGDDLGVLRTKIEYDNLLLHGKAKRSFMG